MSEQEQEQYNQLVEENKALKEENEKLRNQLITEILAANNSGKNAAILNKIEAEISGLDYKVKLILRHWFYTTMYYGVIGMTAILVGFVGGDILYSFTKSYFPK